MPDKDSKNPGEDSKNVSLAREGLDEIFGGRALRSDEATDLRSANDRDSREQAAKAYLHKWGAPCSSDLLAIFVRLKDEELVAQAVEKMAQLAEHVSGSERALLRSALTSRLLTLRDRRLRRSANAVLELLE